MDKDVKFLASRDWTSRPLCCRYSLAIFQSTPIRVGGEQTFAVWGLGLVVGGELEVLGVWVSSQGEGSDLRCVFCNFSGRGVTHISYLMLCNGTLSAGLSELPLGATPLPFLFSLRSGTLAHVTSRDLSAIALALEAVVASSTSQDAESAIDALLINTLNTKYPAIARQWREARAEFQPLFTLGLRLRRLIWTAEAKAELLHQKLVRAVVRHGVFADGEAALAFFGRVLERAQRGFDARGGLLGSFVARSPPDVSKVQRTRRRQLLRADLTR